MKLRVREVIKEKGRRINDVAQEMGVASESLSRIVSGVNSNPKIDTLQQIASALGVEVIDLFKKPAPDKGVVACPNCGATLKIHVEVE
jgi:transcriptional regulator with XRE-family HTH domain